MVENITEPVIHVMPERFFTAPKKGISSRTLFFVFAGMLFVAVVAGAAWYFTKDLRKSVPAVTVTPPAQPAVPEAPASPVVATPPLQAPPVPNPPGVNSAPVETSPVAVPIPGTESLGKPQHGVDSDADGLTDTEEALYGTIPTNPDTDGDGYLDGHELFHLYNPLGREPQKIIDSGIVKQYANDKFGYHIFYPAKWTADPTDASMAEVHFNSATGEFISVRLTENTKNLSLGEWYKSMNPANAPAEFGKFTTKAFDEGLMSPDGMTVYFKNKGYIVTVSYNIGDKNTIEYQRTFEMMLNSLVFLK